MEKRKVWVSRLISQQFLFPLFLSVFLLFISFGYTISISNSLSFFERIINFDITPITSQAIILLQATPITPGQTITDSTSTTRMYSLTITQRSNVTITLEMDPVEDYNVDYDLYVKWDGTLPNQTSYHCRPYKPGLTPEQCENTLDPGTYYIMVKYYSGVGKYKLTVNVNPSTPPPPIPPTPPTPPPTPPSTSVTPITPGQTITDSTSTTRMYSLTITQRSNVTITLEMGTTVDYDLYVKWDGTKPIKSSWDCRPYYDEGMTEQCSNTVNAGTYYFMVKHYKGQGTYKLTVTTAPPQ
ncbi:MAG: PPC domain-containing protein [Candidatus Aenigmatarchaeota archaeon]